MKLPEFIEATVKADGKPLEGVLVHVCILTTSRNDFHSQFGPTDDSGRALITRDALLTAAKRDQELFVMDYGDPETNFDGEVVVSIFGKDDLLGAIKAYPLFKDVADYPPNHLIHLRRALEILEKLGDAKIMIDVVYERVEGVDVRTHY